MKGIIVLLFVVYAAVGHAQNTLLVDKCPEEQEIDWSIELLIKHEDCNKFYKCTLGKPVEYKCAANLWFNLDTQQCDWRDNVDCSDRYVPGEEATTPAEPTTSEPTTAEPTTPEPTTPEPTTPAPTTPAEATPAETTTTSAPTTTTSTSTTTTPAPTTTTSPTTPPITFMPNGCPTNPHIHWLLPHESNCNAFYYCVWGQLVERVCPSTLHFNRISQVCDWPWDAGCPVALNKHLDSRPMMR